MVNLFRKAAYLAIAFRDGYTKILKNRKEFLEFASSSRTIMKDQSFKKLKSLVTHAYNTTPYYNTVMKRVGFNPDDFNEPKDLTLLPHVSKDVIENHRKQLISNRFGKSRLEKSYTGGSSGTPTSFYRDRSCTAMRVGRQLGILELCGYSLGDRCALVWGVHDDLPDNDCGYSLKKKFRKFARADETLCCTILNSKIMMEFYNRLLKFQPKIFYGYPNALAQFAQFIKEKRLTKFHGKTTICTAERLSADQRGLLFEVFGGEVYNLYCTREHGCIGFECKEHKGFHVDIGSVHIEVESSNGNNQGNPGEIVVTDLLNYGMPMIRNKIGDLGQLSHNTCKCSCQLPLISSFDGRVTDMLYRPDGSKVAGVMLVDMFMDITEIKALQIVQVKIDEVDLILKVNQAYNETVGKMALNEIRKHMGEAVKINIRIVSEIPRNPNSGKFQEVICKINPPY